MIAAEDETFDRDGKAIFSIGLVTKSAARYGGLALPIAMLSPPRSNIAISLAPSPMTAISCVGYCQEPGERR